MPGSILKILAAITMLVDHAGLMLFPGQPWMRIVGRIAYPLFAYCIAEGFRYTRHRMRYFLQIFLLGAACQVVYTIAERELYLGILITFSFSLLLMAAVRETLSAWAGNTGTSEEKTALAAHLALPDPLWRILTAAGTLILMGLLYLLSQTIRIDYGFLGILTPVAAYIPRKPIWQKAAFGSMVALLGIHQWLVDGTTTQLWGLAAMVFLLLYNQKPGKHRMKWFFYIFYPAHMAALYLLSYVI